jgi:hypothetical protein
MERVCDCSHVYCKWEVQHACTTYADAVGNVYYQHPSFVSGYFSSGYNVSYGTGDQHGSETGYNRHDSSAACAPSDSVRVHHNNLEQVGLMNGRTGHHCKHTKGGQVRDLRQLNPSFS